jgi:pyruvate dehydrogenase E1 component
MTIAAQPSVNTDLLNRITDRAFAQMVAMIWLANHRSDKQPGDPKVGGHPAACASSCHILGALHLAVREVEDFVCCKPHASPMDHSYHHLMRLFGREDGTWLTDEEARRAMTGLRKFPDDEDFHSVFQSYHARTDPDSFHFLPSGSVGIPPVASVYLALAHRYMADHGREVPHAHFWSLIGDSEFREGSLLEAMPDAAERQLGNVTWIIDYNRQNLDGTRMPNEKGLHSRDCDRIEHTAIANGWRVIQVRHGAFREKIFKRKGGDAVRELFEHVLTDYEYQLALFKRDPELMRGLVQQHSPEAHAVVQKLSDEDVARLFEDVGGHDVEQLVQALRLAKRDPDQPYILVVHTIKGWSLDCFADPSNHSSLPDKSELEALLAARGLSLDNPFEHFPDDSEEARYLAARSEKFRAGVLRSRATRKQRRREAKQAVIEAGGLPDSLDVNLSMIPMVHTQWMWGQLAAKIVRISSAGEDQPEDARISEKPLTTDEQRWAPVSKFVMTMSPDVGTSTNIAPVLDRRIYGAGASHEHDTPEDFAARHPELMSVSAPWTRHIRFEIAEANCMSAAGSFGRMAHYTGYPCFPIMTVYDFFIKRALDQLFYNLYWGAEFVIIGTPSGVTLSPEGAQHSWKSDIQIPNLVTWEPAFAIEVDWILSDAIRRHMMDDNDGRRGILIRAVTRAIPQKALLASLRRQARNKAALPDGARLVPSGADWPEAAETIDESTLAARPDAELLAELRADVLAGAYTLVDWRGYAGYEPGDNVVHVFAMGSLVIEAMAAAEALLERGVFANVIAVSSPELLLGILGEQDEYRHLRDGLGINGDLYVTEALGDASLVTAAGRRVPLVAVCDGEAGLLDNVGSIVGCKQVTLAVRKFSKCGRPDQIFRYQDLDPDSIVDAVGRALAETALEELRVSPRALERLAGAAPGPRRDWRELWPGVPGA